MNLKTDDRAIGEGMPLPESVGKAAASRRLLAKAADALAQFRLVAGVPPPPETSVRAQLEQARERAVRAEALVSELQQRVKLLEAEFVRLHDKRKETLRRLAARATLDAEAASRAVVETLRRELHAANASLDRAAAESARVKTETEDLRKSLESAASAQRSLELEKRLEFAHAAGDASVMAMESQRASAVVAALRLELASVCAAAQQQEEALLRNVAALKAELAAARTAASAAAEEPERAQAVAAKLRAELASVSAVAEEPERAQAVAAKLRAELASVFAATQRQEEALRRDVSALASDLASARADASKAAEELERAQAVAAAAIAALPPEPVPPSLSEAGLSLPMAPSLHESADAPAAQPLGPVGSPLDPANRQPVLEAVLEPGWARLLRLVRPPVEAAYAHLRRLSATALTAGQNAVLRMSAASIAQACDALTTIELSLEEGPAPGPAAPALPALEMSLAAWEPAFRRRGVTLARDFSSASLPDAAHDAKALRVLLYHVFRNALEALPRGGRLIVRAGRGPDGGLRLEFVDDGPGFPPAWLDRRFEPFAEPRRGRAGLGLSLVRRTLRRWGGDAQASNGPAGRGAHLTLTFAP